MKMLFSTIATAIALCCACGPRDGVHTLHLLTTNDVHGTYFDSTYVGGGARKSLLAVKYYADSVRAAAGADNVLFVDAGDCLQGDNAAYYFNYVDTLTPHIYPRLAKKLGYDAVAVGNHDIETGHPVYDRVRKELEERGIAFLAGNAVRTGDGEPYFDTYKVFRKAGLKVAVLGYTNANIKGWLDEHIWSGMDFLSLIPRVQEDVDRVIAKEKPQIVVVAVHSGTGQGDGTQLESQGKDLLGSLRGVDFLVCSHDHRPVVIPRDSIVLVNSGSHSRFVGHGVAEVTVKGGEVVSKTLGGELIPVDARKADPAVREEFHQDYEAVKAFTLREVGDLAMDLRTRDAYKGMCDYINLIQTVCLKATGAVISMAAPLTFNGRVKAGTLVYNDMFTIYPFENQLFVVNMTGREIKDYLEFSYDAWINTVALPSDRLLKIQPGDDPRTGSRRWSFVNRSYNFDSAAGINYTVDVTKPAGKRISITTLASGEEFDPDKVYPVAMTSYRANGGGGIMPRGAGITSEILQERITGKYPEIRNLIYDFISSAGRVDRELISDPSLIGAWSFVPERLASRSMDRDFALIFPK